MTITVLSNNTIFLGKWYIKSPRPEAIENFRIRVRHFNPSFKKIKFFSKPQNKSWEFFEWNFGKSKIGKCRITREPLVHGPIGPRIRIPRSILRLKQGYLCRIERKSNHGMVLKIATFLSKVDFHISVKIQNRINSCGEVVLGFLRNTFTKGN